MAKKKHHKKTHRRRRSHRMGGVSDILTKIGGIGIGAVGAVFINAAVKKSLPTIPAWVGGAAGVVAGVVIPMIAKNNKLADYASAGAAGMGFVFVLNETFLSLPGISGVATQPMFRGAGFVNTSVGYAAPGVLNETIGGVKDLAVIGALYDN